MIFKIENTNKFNNKEIIFDSKDTLKNKKRIIKNILDTYDEDVLFNYLFPGFDEASEEFYYKEDKELTYEELSPIVLNSIIVTYDFDFEKSDIYSDFLLKILKEVYEKSTKDIPIKDFISFFKETLIVEFFINDKYFNELEKILTLNIFSNEITIYTEEAFEVGKYVFLNPTITFKV